MVNLKITENEENQRLDKFLKKYYAKAPLSYLYKLIRKNIKVNGKRVSQETRLRLGDEIVIYISQEEAESYREDRALKTSKKQFRIAYEDENLLAAEKPMGLLVHGTKEEKKNTLANQVLGYLIEEGAYRPGVEKTFTPAPANRLDRNTTGLVLFGKNYGALRALTLMLRERGYLQKYYLTITSGTLETPLFLKDRMEKDERRNRVSVMPIGPHDTDGGKRMETIARPLAAAGGLSLVEVELVTGRTHQIRAHLASAGYPVAGDEKYGNSRINRMLKDRFGLSTQFLHASRIVFQRGFEPLEYLAGKEIRSLPPPRLCEMGETLFGEAWKNAVGRR